MRIKSYSTHIVFLLLLSFGFSIIPFHAFHLHQETEHKIALQSNNKAHTCELDFINCQYAYKQDICKHKTHLDKTLKKCFTCNYHFAKNYISNYNIELKSYTTAYKIYVVNIALKQNAYKQLICNKGPPVL